MKKVTSFPHWKGFEFTPNGCLLDQVIDLNPKMGFAYERSCQFYKDFHAHDRLMLVCPRGSSVMEVRTLNSKQTYRVDSSSILIVPKGLVHDDEGISCIYDTMALYPSDELIVSVADKAGLKKSNLKILREKCIQIERTKVLSKLTQEYFFEKVVNKLPHGDLGLEYLDTRIFMEVLGALYPVCKKQDTSPFDDENGVTTKALRFIESNLFENLNLDNVARHSGASVSTLLRKFKSELSQTPYSYIKSRRLEEAMSLLKNGSHSVSEVAILVGYENFGAFTDAFKSKYGKAPSKT